MKRIKKFYQEHRIFIILLSIMLVGIILIVTILMQCFYSSGDTNDSEAGYGTRLENKDKYIIEDSRIYAYEAKLTNEENVKEAHLRIQGRIVYVKIEFQNDISIPDAENIASKSLEDFSEEEKTYYDFHFTLEKQKTETSDYFIISGAKNKTSNNVVWNNNRIVPEEEE